MNTKIIRHPEDNLRQPNQSQSALARGLAIMEWITAQDRAVSSAEAAEALALPRPTVHRMAQQLERQGFLQRVPGSKRFSGGSRLHSLSLAALSNSVVGAPRHAVLQALSEEIEETCNCTMLEGSHIVYFDRVEANWPYRIHLPVGTHVPLHCTASGKLFLALMPAVQRDRLLSTLSLTRYTELTITDRRQLENQLNHIKEQGIALDEGEYLAGLIALAIPILDLRNRICFAIAVHVPTARRSLEELWQYLPAMRRAAGKLSQLNNCEAESNAPGGTPRRRKK